MSDLAARLRKNARLCYYPESADLCKDWEEAADALDSAARRDRELRELCNERKWSVMVDNDGREEDALLAVDVLRVLDSQRGENE